MQNNKAKLAPLKINKLKNRLVDQLHQDVGLKTSQIMQSQNIPIFGQKKNVQINRQFNEEIHEDQHENSIVMLNSPDVHRKSFSQIKRQKGLFKIMKVECGSNHQTAENDKMGHKQYTHIYDFQKKSQDSLIGISQIKFKKDISFRAKSIKNQQEGAQSQPNKHSSDEVPIKNPESHNYFERQSQIIKKQVDESFQVSQQFESPQIKKALDSHERTTPIAKTQSKESSSIYYTTMKKKSEEHNSSHDNATANNNRFNKTQNHIFSPMKKPSSFMSGLKSEKNIGIQSILKKVSQQKTNILDEPIFNSPTFQSSKQKIANKSRKKYQKELTKLDPNSIDEQTKQTIKQMTEQKSLKLKDYLRLTSLSNDSKFDRYSKSLTKVKNLGNNSKGNQNGLNEMKKSAFLNKNKSAIDPSKSILLIKASLKKKLEKAIESALRILQEVGQNSGLIGNQYEDLVFMCNFHRIFDQNLFKSVSLLENLMEECVERKKKIDYFKILQDIIEKFSIFSPL